MTTTALPNLDENKNHNHKLKATALSAPAVTLASTHNNTFPRLIYNDTNRSTAYVPKTTFDMNESANKTKYLNSPLATQVTYNWPTAERERTQSVRSKSKVFKPVARIIEPSRPPAPYKVNSSWETLDTHFHNEKRALEMKRFQYLKEHTTWSIYPYARIQERESYNKSIRETLKNQMEQKLSNAKKEFLDKCAESKVVLIKDKEVIQEDRQKRAEKSKMSNTYSVSNKQLMEDRWMGNYFLKRDEWLKERELLNQTPINWSKTLK